MWKISWKNVKIKRKCNLVSPSSYSILAWFWLSWSFLDSSLTLETFCFLIGSSRIGEFDLFRLSRRHFVNWSSTFPAFLLKVENWFVYIFFFFEFQISRQSEKTHSESWLVDFLAKLRFQQGFTQPFLGGCVNPWTFHFRKSTNISVIWILTANLPLRTWI